MSQKQRPDTLLLYQNIMRVCRQSATKRSRETFQHLPRTLAWTLPFTSTYSHHRHKHTEEFPSVQTTTKFNINLKIKKTHGTYSYSSPLARATQNYARQYNRVCSKSKLAACDILSKSMRERKVRSNQPSSFTVVKSPKIRPNFPKIMISECEIKLTPVQFIQYAPPVVQALKYENFVFPNVCPNCNQCKNKCTCKTSPVQHCTHKYCTCRVNIFCHVPVLLTHLEVLHLFCQTNKRHKEFVNLVENNSTPEEFADTFY